MKKENVFFLEKKHVFFIIFSNFSNVQSFLFFFCQINLIMRAEKTFLRNITILYAFYSKFTTFSDLKKFFFEKPTYFLKNPNFERFEKIYYFSRILRQICYNSMKKNFDIRTREQSMLARLRGLNWQTSGKKTHQFERNILLPIWCKIMK